MESSLTDRALLLIKASSIEDLAKAGETNYSRWVNIKRGKARVGADEIEILAKMYPDQRWWLISGETKLESGQLSPILEDNMLELLRRIEKTKDGTHIKEK